MHNSDFVWTYPVKHKNEGGEALKVFYRENIGVSDSAGDHEMFLVLQSDRDSVAKSDKLRGGWKRRELYFKCNRTRYAKCS